MVAKIRISAVGRIAAGAVCMTAVAIFALAAAAAEPGGKKMPIYMGVMQTGAGETQVKFVFSDVSQPGRFAPRQAFSIRPKNGNCNMAPDGDLALPSEYTGTPVYDMAKDAEKIPIADLPNYFASLASAEMHRKGYAATEKDSLPVATCTRIVWEAIVGAE